MKFSVYFSFLILVLILVLILSIYQNALPFNKIPKAHRFKYITHKSSLVIASTIKHPQRHKAKSNLFFYIMLFSALKSAGISRISLQTCISMRFLLKYSITNR